MKRFIKLQPRLKAIADFIENGSSVADIGTDHGFLPVYLAQHEIACRIIASDMSAGSLAAARRSAAKHRVTDQIEFITAPGLSGVNEADADTVVIAGVGGETIIGILENAFWTKHPGKRLILQPQTKINELIYWLKNNGYDISKTDNVFDRGRTYTILVVKGEIDNASSL